MHSKLTTAVLIWAALYCANASVAETLVRPPPPQGEATEFTRKANAALAARLPLDDPTDFANATRGRLAQIEGGQIKAADGRVVFDASIFAFLKGKAPPTVNPSLWRQSQLTAEHGLFEVVDGVYQVRGYDLAVMTLIRGKSGWIIVDPLGSKETAAASLELANKTLGARPVRAVIITHSHADHWGGTGGVLTSEEIDGRQIPIVAPEGFLDHAVSENLMAGAYMQRRGGFQLGAGLPRNPLGLVGTAIGTTTGSGTLTLPRPTLEVPAGSEPLVLDGITFEFVDAAGTEAPSEFMFYLPDYKVLNTAELVSATFHNVLTQRGAQIRNALVWSKSIDAALRKYGDRSVAMIRQHNWPVWDSPNIKTALENQRDLYRYVHDQTLRLAGTGETMSEIAEQIGEPAYRNRDFATRDYYGTMNHNAKAVFQFYFGWWDGVPANYNRWPPAEESARYVEAMGGAEAALQTGIRAYDRGDYRWSSVVFNHVVFAQPDNTVAKSWLASSYEQQGFQAEAGTWRNYFLKAAQELREGPPATVVGPTAALATLIAGVPTETLFETLLARYDPQSWLTPGTTIQIIFTDTQEDVALHVREGSVFPRFGERAAEPVVTLTTQRTLFNQVLTDPSARVKSIFSPDWKVTGNPLALVWFFGSIGGPPKPFNIVTP